MNVEDIQLVLGKSKFSLNSALENEEIQREIELFAKKLETLMDTPLPGILKGRTVELRLRVTLDK